MSTIKGTLKHSRKGGGGRGGGREMRIQMEEKWESSMVQKDNSLSFKSPARERREPRGRNSSHILEIIQNIT